MTPQRAHDRLCAYDMALYAVMLLIGLGCIALAIGALDAVWSWIGAAL